MVTQNIHRQKILLKMQTHLELVRHVTCTLKHLDDLYFSFCNSEEYF